MSPEAPQPPAPPPAPEQPQPPEPRAWRCCRCDEKLVPKKTVLSYMGYSVAHEVPTCPKCGKVYIPCDLAEGRMLEVEQQLEDK